MSDRPVVPVNIPTTKDGWRQAYIHRTAEFQALQDQLRSLTEERDELKYRVSFLDNMYLEARTDHADKLEAERQRDDLSAQIGELAEYIMENIKGEPSQSQGAVVTAIRIMRSLTEENERLKKQLKIWEIRDSMQQHPSWFGPEAQRTGRGMDILDATPAPVDEPVPGLDEPPTQRSE